MKDMNFGLEYAHILYYSLSWILLRVLFVGFSLTRPQSSSYNFISRAARGEGGAQIEMSCPLSPLSHLAPYRVLYGDDWGRVRIMATGKLGELFITGLAVFIGGWE